MRLYMCWRASASADVVILCVCVSSVKSEFWVSDSSGKKGWLKLALALANAVSRHWLKCFYISLLSLYLQTKWKNVYVIRSDEMRFLRHTNIVFFCQIDIKFARFASMHFCAHLTFKLHPLISSFFRMYRGLISGFSLSLWLSHGVSLSFSLYAFSRPERIHGSFRKTADNTKMHHQM